MLMQIILLSFLTTFARTSKKMLNNNDRSKQSYLVPGHN